MFDAVKMASLNHTKCTRAQTTHIRNKRVLFILISYDEVVIQLREICDLQKDSHKSAKIVRLCRKNKTW